MLVPFVHMLSTFFCTSSPHEGGRHHKSVSNSYNGSRLHRAAWKQGCHLHTLLLSYCTGKVEKGYVIAALVEASRSLIMWTWKLRNIPSLTLGSAEWYLVSPDSESTLVASPLAFWLGVSTRPVILGFPGWCGTQSSADGHQSGHTDTTHPP